jgi:hypothetical protein
MKLLGIGAGNPDGSAEILLKEALRAAEGAEVSYLRLDEVDLNAHADWLSGTVTLPRNGTPPASRPAASTAASSPARWRTGPTASPTPWSATKPSTTPAAGPDHTWPFLDRCPKRRRVGVVNLERPEPAFCAGEDERR